MTQQYDVLVIGGGQAGLAAGYHLQRAGLSFVILEGAPEVGGSWPQYYDSLRLFSPAARSSLPGLAFPGNGRRYPARDEVVSYLRHYAQHFALPISTNTRVAQVEVTTPGFQAITAGGMIYQARSVIAATGAFHHPFIPTLPGQEHFQGRVLHSATYRSPEPFANQRVLVVGAGNSAIQIGAELARVAQVTLATRTPIQFRPQTVLGHDIHYWAWLLGLDRLPISLFNPEATATGVLDTGVYQAAIEAGRPDRRPLFTRFTPTGVIWPHGIEEPVDAIVFATGYRPNLEYLAELGALDANGQPLHRRGVSTTVPGLVYVGLSNQSTYASATLRGVGPDAAFVIRHLRRYLHAHSPAHPRHSQTADRLFGRWQCCAGKRETV